MKQTAQSQLSYERLELKNRFFSSVALFAWIIIAYAIPNNFVLFEPFSVPLTEVDRMIPLSPVWTWIYVSYYPFIYFAYFAARNSGNAKRYLNMMAFSALIAMLIFFFYPTIIIREAYPIPEAGLSAFALSIIRTFDNSVNCLPSMHIAMSCMAAYTYASESKRWTLPAYMWALLIAYSTMATKQHYFWDVVGGASLALVMVVVSSAVAFRFPGRSLFQSRLPSDR